MRRKNGCWLPAGTRTVELVPSEVTGQPVSVQGPAGLMADCTPNEPAADGQDN
jgi:hypothetical protein